MHRSIVYSILLQTIVVQYYKLNAGFFFMLIVFTFGLLRNTEHIAIANAMLNSSFLLCLLFVLWTIYVLKTTSFVTKAFSLPQNQFLYGLYLLPVPARMINLLLVQLLLMAPVLLYGVFLAYVGLTIHELFSLLWVVLFVAVSLTGTLIWYNMHLAKPDVGKKQSVIGRYWRFTYSKPYFSFGLIHLLTRHQTLVLGSKLLACFTLWAAIQLYILEDRNRLILYVGTLMAMTAQAVVIYHLQVFEQTALALMKNMPIAVRKRFFYLVWAYCLLLLPETIILSRYPALEMFGWLTIQMLIYSLSLLLLYHSFLLIQYMELKIFIRRLFFIMLFYLFIILSKTDITFIAACNLLLSYYLYQKYFYMYEPLPES